jgi:hypothetical protein
VPVGVLVPPLTVTVTVRDWVVEMLEAEGVTDTVGVTSAGGGVMDELLPPPQALRARLKEVANRSAAIFASCFIFISPVLANQPVTAPSRAFRACCTENVGD